VPAEAAVAVDAFETYEVFAPFYDDFTAGYDYESWMSEVEAWARDAGLSGRRVLDAACGTGSSFVPLLERGYEVVGCDISPAMVDRARARANGAADVVVADLRELPWRERFDLVTCVDDSINYLLSEDDLVAALREIHAALRPGGLALFDFNSLLMYRTCFTGEFEVESGGRRFRWRGDGRTDMLPGDLATGAVDLLIEGQEPVPLCQHVQRHHPIDTVVTACGEAGLEIVEMRGESPAQGLVPHPDEDAHLKIACLARR
jgi:SAM-dependent methyltransferase